MEEGFIGVDNYLKKVDYELANKDSIPGGMPEWLVEELMKAREILNSDKVFLEDKGRCMSFLDEYFWEIRALRENNINEIEKLKQTQLEYDEKIASEVANGVICTFFKNHKK